MSFNSRYADQKLGLWIYVTMSAHTTNVQSMEQEFVEKTRLQVFNFSTNIPYVDLHDVWKGPTLFSEQLLRNYIIRFMANHVISAIN